MILVLLLTIALAFAIAGFAFSRPVGYYDAAMVVCYVVSIVLFTILFFACLCAGVAYTGTNGQIASNRARYESLLYQAENSLYENDNDLGKKELANEIREWNQDVAEGKALQRDFWVGVFHPNIWDDFEPIPLELLT